MSKRVTRPVLRWHGGKYKLAAWIIKHLPPHRIYVEPFGGAASVLMQKAPSYAEVYNDLDDQVVTLFRILQDPGQAEQLRDRLMLTPYSRLEFNKSYELTNDPMEVARRLVIRAYMGFGSNAHASTERGHRSTGFRANANRSGTTPARDWKNYPDAIPAMVERLRGVIIEHRDAFAVMAQHDGPATVHYVDPPYMPDTRSMRNPYDRKYRMYRHELDAEGHVKLLEFLQTLEGMVVLSGYATPLYDDGLPGWRRVTREAYADGARKRTEVLWINQVAVAALPGALGTQGDLGMEPS